MRVDDRVWTLASSLLDDVDPDIGPAPCQRLAEVLQQTANQWMEEWKKSREETT